MKLHHMKNYQPLLCDVYDYKRFAGNYVITKVLAKTCLLYTSPSPRDATLSRMPSSA